MTIRLSYEDAVLGLKIAVGEKGENYQYDRPERGKDCVYFDQQTRSPSCIVGHVLAQHGVTGDDLSMSPDVQPRPLNERGVGSLRDANIIEVDERTLSLLEIAQDNQDCGVPWGQALDGAITAMATYSPPDDAA